MPLTTPMRIFAVFTSDANLDGALSELEVAGFPMAQISVVKKEVEPQTVVKKTIGNKSQVGTNIGAITGGAAGGFLGLLVGFGTAALVPGVGPLLLVGEAALALTTTLTSGVIGATAGSLLGALIGAGIPEEHAKVYHERIARGEYFLMLNGTEADIRQAEAIFSRWNAQEVRTYQGARSGS